jgi:F0F1-type ATP synthase assembly protein I
MTPQPQSAWSGYGTAWSIIALLLSGMVAWGGIGMLIDWLLGFRWLFLPIGILVGTGSAIYLVYLKYGKEDPRE